ncbi:MAG: DUF3089 domain-containing protein [Bacteroidota bacterium]
MKKLTFLIIGCIIGIGLLIWGIGLEKMVIYMISPQHDFSIDRTPTALDYSLSDSWAALPQKNDYSDLYPTGVSLPDTLLQAVDVFFIHPTTYFTGKHWNESIDLTSGTSQRIDRIMANNASIFNACKVYAPRYRQATITSFLNMKGDNEQKALALAYEDVKRAFLYFLANYNLGRPFVLAGHSQGSLHGKLLLEELIDGQPLAKKMIAAYLMGSYYLSNDWADSLSEISVCDSPTQTHCLLNFNTYAKESKPALEWENSQLLCVNPLNWKRDGGYAPKSAHLGYVLPTGEMNFPFFGRDTPDELPTGPLSAPLPAHTYATCENGVLLIENQQVETELEKGNYHILELSLFYMNIRANVAERCYAYLEAQVNLAQ